MIADDELRGALCEVGRRVWQKNYVASNDGNFSFRIAENAVLCTPTMISKGFMKPEDMVIVDLQGNQIGGSRKATSEIKIHLFIYQRRPDVYSVVHVHPPHATAFAVTRQELPKCVLPEIELFLGEIPLVPYATTGTWEFAHSIAPWVENHDAFLLTNHGAVTVGLDPYDAYYKMETLDQYCRILLLAAQAGDWNRIDHAGMMELLRVKEKLGVPDPRGVDFCAPGAARPSRPRPFPNRFVPHPGPITDAPKLSGTSPFAGAAKHPAGLSALDSDARMIVDEVLRRLAKK
ncbi:class II aldolase/adducin family protein [Candidatus Sumerlaeota bacterium]|nr:class II aldolase/adducin family protein [Candidatus Sumerlaeota bacterium]